VFKSFIKIPSYLLKILCLVCVLVLLAAPVLAQEQTPKEKTPPPAAPPPMPREYQAEKSKSIPMGGEDMKMKGVDDTVGGQEIRNKKGPEDK
jgi:hypothetical protein